MSHGNKFTAKYDIEGSILSRYMNKCYANKNLKLQSVPLIKIKMLSKESVAL